MAQSFDTFRLACLCICSVWFLYWACTTLYLSTPVKSLARSPPSPSWSLVTQYELTSVCLPSDVGLRRGLHPDPRMSSYLVELRADRSTVGRQAARPGTTTVGRHLTG